MKKTILLSVLAALCLFSALYAQTQKAIPLQIGDQVPEHTFTRILHPPSAKTRLSDHRNGLVILDFMTTFCGSCIEAIPDLQKLQQEFGGQLQLFLVSYEDRPRVEKFLQHNHIGQHTTLPFVYGDKVLHGWFPHAYVSHEAWIYKGKVIAITGKEYVNAANIKMVLSGAEVRWPVKNDLRTIDYRVPLLSARTGSPQQQISTYSAFLPYIDGTAARKTVIHDTAGHMYRYTYFNHGALALLLSTFPGKEKIPLSHIRMATSRADQLRYNRKDGYHDAWDKTYTTCYETVLPDTLNESMRNQKIREDIDRYFGLTTALRQSSISCYEIYALDIERDPTVAANTTELKVDEYDFQQLKDLLRYLNSVYPGTPVITSLDTDQKIFLRSRLAALADPAQLEQLLRKSGLGMRQTRKDILMLIIEDHKQP